jgi:hypothetical protein
MVTTVVRGPVGLVERGAGAPAMSLSGLPGEMRMPVRSAPISPATAVATSTAKRMRFSMLPP